jgi:phenylalanyl-tRNA synthetase beta chain
VAGVLRGVTFDQARYDSFIDLQDKLHQNICRKRTLVAIGTHDLDTLQGPFTYEALAPSEIKFVPLKQTKEFTAKELMEFYKGDIKLKKFLPIIENSPVYPVIYDKNRTVLSLPPIINGAHSAITLNTKNVFIECTATDLTKAKIVLNTMVTMFSQYCSRKFEVEPVEVSNEGKSVLYPDLSPRTMEVDVSYINNTIGVRLSPMEIARHLYRMQLSTKVTKTGDNAKVTVTVPPTRSDVLHPCDVMEDVAIAFGFNNIEKTVPKSHTLGKQQALNHFTDLVRVEVSSE